MIAVFLFDLEPCDCSVDPVSSYMYTLSVQDHLVPNSVDTSVPSSGTSTSCSQDGFNGSKNVCTVILLILCNYFK